MTASDQSNLSVGDHVRALNVDHVGVVTGFDEGGRPIVRWANGVEAPHSPGSLVKMNE